MFHEAEVKTEKKKSAFYAWYLPGQVEGPGAAGLDGHVEGGARGRGRGGADGLDRTALPQPHAVLRPDAKAVELVRVQA